MILQMIPTLYIFQSTVYVNMSVLLSLYLSLSDSHCLRDNHVHTFLLRNQPTVLCSPHQHIANITLLTLCLCLFFNAKLLYSRKLMQNYCR